MRGPRGRLAVSREVRTAERRGTVARPPCTAEPLSVQTTLRSPERSWQPHRTPGARSRGSVPADQAGYLCFHFVFLMIIITVICFSELESIRSSPAPEAGHMSPKGGQIAFLGWERKKNMS